MLAGPSVGAVVVHTLFFGNRVAAPIVGDAHVDLFRVEVAGPEEAQGSIDLLQIGVRLDLWTEAGDRCIPLPMKIICQHSKPVGLLLKTFDVQILEVVVLRWNHHTKAQAAAEALAHFFHQFDLVLTVIRRAATAFASRPLPVDVNTRKVPLVQELLERIYELLAVLLSAHHVGPGSASCAWVRELEATNADPLLLEAGKVEKFFVDGLVGWVHHLDLESRGVDRRES